MKSAASFTQELRFRFLAPSILQPAAPVKAVFFIGSAREIEGGAT
jgi:hypothetical protein